MEKSGILLPGSQICYRFVPYATIGGKMRVLTIGALLLATAALATLAAGLVLAPTRQGTAERLLPGRPELVSEILADVAAQPGWRSGIASVEVGPDGWVERTEQGEAITFRPVVQSADRIELQFESTRGYRGTWVGEITAQGDGTLLRVTETATTPSPVGRILSRLFFDPQAYSTAYLDALQIEVQRRGGAS